MCLIVSHLRAEKQRSKRKGRKDEEVYLSIELWEWDNGKNLLAHIEVQEKTCQ